MASLAVPLVKKGITVTSFFFLNAGWGGCYPLSQPLPSALHKHHLFLLFFVLSSALPCICFTHLGLTFLSSSLFLTYFYSVFICFNLFSDFLLFSCLFTVRVSLLASHLPQQPFPALLSTKGELLNF